MLDLKPMEAKNGKAKKNKGFSLLEVLISMLILAIIIAPILGNIMQASRVNQMSRRIQDASNLGQNMMEGIKSQASFEEVAKQLIYKKDGVDFSLFTLGNLESVITKQIDYDAASDTYIDAASPCITRLADMATGEYSYTLEENSNRKYIFQASNIIYNDNNYCARIVYDASAYSKVDPTEEDKFNDIDMPILPSVSDEKNAVVALTYQDEWAKSTLKQQYNVYFNSTTRGENTVTNDDIGKDMKRSLTLDLNYDAVSGKYIVKGTFTYTLSTLIPNGVVAYPNKYEDVFFQKEFSSLENVYLFFAPRLEVHSDEININNNLPADAADINVYFVEQLREDLVASGTYENLMSLYELTVNLKEVVAPLDPLTNEYIYHTRIRTNLGSTIEGFRGISRIKYPGIIGNKVNQAVLIDREEDKTRLYNISIDLYREPKAGTDMFKESDYLISFTSSKGES